MISYPIIANTSKNIDRFLYNTYRSIGINLFKYQNESSTIYRLISCSSSLLDQSLKDLEFNPGFNLNNINLSGIDRLNSYHLSSIPNIGFYQLGQLIKISNLQGYSRFTNKLYGMKYIKSDTEFIRHSLPCDIFLTKTNYDNQILSLYTLRPNKELKVNKYIDNSQITISPENGFSIGSLNKFSTYITILIKGINIHGDSIEEKIDILEKRNYITFNEYSIIESITSLGNKSSVSVGIYPYVAGNDILWNEYAIEKDFEDIDLNILLSIDSIKKQLILSTLVEDNTVYPKLYDAIKEIDFNIPEDISFIDNYIDINNKLIYILGSDNRLYCFPLLIPIKYNKDLDILKTKYQSLKVSYRNDIVNKQYIFDIFPSQKTIDIEILGIFINDIEYDSNILLDLYRENIDTNKIEIPYSELFKDSNECIVKFITYGTQESIVPIYLYKEKLDYLYIKDLNDLNAFESDTYNAEGSSLLYIPPTNKSSNIIYVDPIIVDGFININEDSKLYKLSNGSNVIIDKYEIVNVFNAFTYSDIHKSIITHDSINFIGLLNNSISVYETPNIVGYAISGLTRIIF